MTKKIAALAALVIVLLTQRPLAQTGARIFFVDVGTGAGTLIVSPNGTTLLVDGGPPTAGTNRILPLLNTLGLPKIDYTIVTHYHIDHMGGMIEVLNSGKVSGGIAYDNGDGADVQPPGTSTGSTSTRGTYLNYIAATAAGGATRQTAVPGTVIDLGGGMKATIVAAGGKFLSGGSVPFTTDDLNSESISVLVEFNTFDYLVSGDLTGGGSTSTAKTPDIETYVGQMVGDVDVVQLDHHGSTTGNNQAFLSALKAEVAFAQTGESNGFGHPNRESINKYLNTPATTGAMYAGTGVPAPGAGPVFYQNEAPQAGDDRVTLQGYSGAAAGAPGTGTIRLATDGTTTYSLTTVTDSGVRIPASTHTYPVDGVSTGITTDFKPTVVVSTLPVLPLSTDSLAIAAAINDRESAVSGAILSYALNGAPQAPVTMTLSSAGIYRATIPPQPDGTRVDYTVSGAAGLQTTTSAAGYFSGFTPVSSLRALNALGEPLYNGYPARIMATVTASGFSSGTNDDYAQDATGGINIYKSSNGPTPYLPTTPGQVIEARGRVGFLGGRHRLDLTESVEKLTSPFGLSLLSTGAAPAPTATTFAVLGANPEAFEGQLVSIANVSIVSGAIPATPQSLDAFLTVTDGTAHFPLKVDHDTDVEGFAPAAIFTAVGIIQQDDYLRPFTSGYNLTPRSAADLGAAAAPGAPLLTIADARVDAVTNADGNPPADTIPDLITHVVKVRGAVTSIDFRGGNGIEYYIQDATGGIDVFSTSANFGPFAIGDNVEAIGAITQFNGLTEISASSVVSLPGTTAVTPQVVTLAQLADGAGDALEGRLIRVNNVTIITGAFPALNASGNVTIADATGTTVLRIDSDTDIDGTAAPSGVFSVIALASQFDSAAPFDSGYQLLPRMLGDIETMSCSAISIGGALSGGTVGAQYAQTLTANGGTSPYTFSVVGGALPGGLSLSTAGTLAGTPVAAGSFTFTVAASAADGCLGVASRTVAVVSPLPVLSASPAALAFGSVAIGDAPTSLVTLTNTGTAPLVLNASAPIAGTDASQFQVTMPSPLTIASGGSTTANVKFTPTTAGTKTATLTISSNGGTTTIALTGAGSASPSGIGIVISEFRLRGLAGGNDEFVEIYNNTDAPVNIGGYTMRGSNNAGGVSIRATLPANVVLPARAHFLLVNNNTSGPYAGPVPGNLTYGTGIGDDGGLALFNNATTAAIVDQVGLSTTAGNAGSAYKEGTVLPNLGTTTASNFDRGYQRRPGGTSLVLQDTNDNATDFVLTVPSNPQNLVLGPTPGSLNFGGVLLPGAGTQTATIKNMLLGVPNSTVTLSTAAISGPDAASFIAGSLSATTLVAGGTATVPITFQPSTDGLKTATLTVTTTTGVTLAIPLSGTGLLGISVAPTSIDFGPTEAGSQADRTVTITNGNPTAVTLTSPFAMTGNKADFTVGAPGSSTIAGGGTTTAVVTFHATTLGPTSAMLTIASTSGGTRSVALSAVAACQAITVSGTLPDGEFGRAYSQALNAAGYGGPFTFAIEDGSLPAGLTLNQIGAISGTTGDVGAFTFTAQATAANGCTGSASFTLTGIDTTPPTVTVPANITTEATGATTAVTFTATASDVVEGSIVPVCHPASGFGFPVGTTPISCTATDAHGLSATARFDVTVTDTTPPALIIPANITVEATGVTTAVNFTASATDLGVSIAPVCTPASGFAFPVGTTSVSCTATDTHGLSATAHFDVTITDTTPPALTVPATITVEATGATTPVSFTASATDLGISIAPVCTPASGFAFPVGTTSVSCTATDTHGLSASAHFDVTITDTMPPALTVPATITVEATGATTPVSFTASATDLGISIAPVCMPASGFAFTVGTTSVSCTATDTHGLSATAHFDVTITDNTPPALVAPSDITAAATSPAGAIVTFAATASDVVDGPRPVTCGPPSGTTFAIGATTVICTASDLRGNSASRTFTVTVTESEAPGRITGNAAIEIGAVTHDVDFKVQERVSGAEAGTLRYTVRTKKQGRDLQDEFVATLVDAVSFFNEPGVSPGKRPASGVDTVSFAGTGRWNKQRGYTFSAVAIDAGEPGRGRDSFAITVKDPTGHVVATVNAVITNGNIQSSRAQR